MKKILAIGFEEHLGQSFGRVMSGVISQSAVAEVSSARQAITILNSSGAFDGIVGVFDSADERVLPAVHAIRTEHPNVALFALFDYYEPSEPLVQTISAFVGTLDSSNRSDAAPMQHPCRPFQRTSWRSGARAGTPHLTRRQRDVLGLIRDGYSNKEIARALELSEGTVKIHCLAIYRELGVANRTQAAIAAEDALSNG